MEILIHISQQHLAEVIYDYSEYSAADSSKDDDRAVFVVFDGENGASLFASSIYTAKANFILLSLRFVSSCDKSKFTYTVQFSFMPICS